jgi:hypothetical protein
MIGKREIVAAATRKGVKFAVCEWSYEPTPSGIASGWHIELTDASIEALGDLGFDDISPDCQTATEVIKWVRSMPDCLSAAQGEKHD